MKKYIVLVSIALTFTVNSWAESISGPDNVERIFQSEDFRERIGELQNEGYVLFKLEDLMDRSKFEMKPRATQNIDISLSINPNDSKLCGSVTLYDAVGNAHAQQFCFFQSSPNQWVWMVETQKGPLNLGRNTTSRISFASGLNLTFSFAVTVNKSIPSQVLKVVQDGYTRGTFAGWSEGPDSNHREAIYSNGETQIIEFRKQ